MTAKHGYRIAVIVNEYGEEVGIESASVQVVRATSHPFATLSVLLNNVR